MDPATIMIGSMITTAIGAGISAYGQTVQGAAAAQQGQYQAGMYTYQAGVAKQFAGAEDTQARLQIASGEVEAQQAGLVSRASMGREITEAGAGNIDVTSGSTARVTSSQVAIGQENEALARSRAAQVAYNSELQGASYRAQAGGDVAAAKEAVIAGGVARTAYDVGAAGTVVSGLGSVDAKWYQYKTATGTGPSTIGGTGLSGSDWQIG